MIGLINKNTFKSIGVRYIFSGIFFRLAKVFCSFYILKFIEPIDLGEWQQFTTFFPYVMIFTLGVSNTVNLELPAHIGANEKYLGLKKVSVAGYFINILSFIFCITLVFIGGILYFLKLLQSLNIVYWLISIFIVLGTINNNFLRSTFRSSSSFSVLSKLQLFLSLYAILIIPFGFYFGVLGIALHLLLAMTFEFLLMFFNRPFKIKYTWNKKTFIQLVRVGSVLYIWNNLNIIYRTLPRLSIVITGDILTLGLYSPVASINALSSNIAETINTYTFPKMSFLFGKYKVFSKVIQPLKKTIFLIFTLLFLISFFSYLLLPYVIINFLPNFTESVDAVKIIVFAGPFFYINLTMHKFIISIRQYDYFKFLIPSKYLLYVTIYLLISYFNDTQFLIQVAYTVLVSEIFTIGFYLFFIRKAIKNENNF